MKIVYKIVLSTGQFYIGCTIREVRERLKQHLAQQKTEKSFLFKRLKLSLDDLVNLTNIVYEGWDAAFVEALLIYADRDNPFMLNTQVNKKKPIYQEWIRSQQMKYPVETSIHLYGDKGLDAIINRKGEK